MHYFKYLKWDTVQQLEDSIPLCSVLYKQDQHIKTSLCLGDYKAGNWLEIFHRPVKAKLAVMLNPKGKNHHLCHSTCTRMLISLRILYRAWPGWGWPCTGQNQRKEPSCIITKADAPSTIFAAGWILGLSDLWDSAQSFLQNQVKAGPREGYLVLT